MFEYILNGQKLVADQVISLDLLLEQHGFKLGEVAVVVDQVFVPRSEYTNYMIQTTHTIEVLAPMQGG